MPRAIKFPKPGEFCTGKFGPNAHGQCCLLGWAFQATDHDRDASNRLMDEMQKVIPRGYMGVADYNDHPDTTDEDRARVFAQAATAAGFVEAP